MYLLRSIFKMALSVTLLALPAIAQPKTFNFDADAADSVIAFDDLTALPQ